MGLLQGDGKPTWFLASPKEHGLGPPQSSINRREPIWQGGKLSDEHLIPNQSSDQGSAPDWGDADTGGAQHWLKNTALTIAACRSSMPREQQLMLCALCDPLPFSLAFPHILCHGSKLAQRNVGAPSLEVPKTGFKAA